MIYDLNELDNLLKKIAQNQEINTNCKDELSKVEKWIQVV